MKWFLSLSIRTHMLVLIVVMTVVPLGAIVFSALKQRQYDLQEAENIAQRLVNEVGNDHNALLASTEQLFNLLSHDPAVRLHDKKAVNKLLAEIVNKNPQYDNLLLADRTGILWATAVPARGTVSYADRRYFKAALSSGKFSSGEYSISRTLHKPIMSYAAPIRDASGTITDVAIVAFTLGKYAKLVKARNLPANTSIVLSDHKGTILFAPLTPNLVGMQEGEHLFRRMSGENAAGVFTAVGNVGVRRIFAYQQLRLEGEKTPFGYLRAGIPVEALLAKSRQTMIFNVGIMSAILLSALAFALFVSKRCILDKIITLRDASQRIASGDLEVRIANHVSGGELGELGHAFDEMADNLARDIIKLKCANDTITDRERSLGEKEKRYRELVEQSAAWIWEADKNLRHVYSNSNVEVMLGYSVTDFLRLDIFSILHPDDHETIRKLVAQAISSRAGWKGVVLRWKHLDGSWRSIQTNGKPRHDNEGRFLGLRGIDLDITDRILLQEERDRAQRLESIGILAGSIAHDFNNILTAMMGNIFFARNSLDPSHEAYPPLANAEKATRRAASLTKQLLIFAKGGQPVKKVFSLKQVLQETVALILNDMQIKTSIDIPDSLHALEADDSRISQALHNIMINAVQAMPEGGRLTIQGENVALAEDNEFGLAGGDYVKLAVTDEGCGIAEADQKKIFTPYFSTKPRGTGLGLAATYAIITSHGGKIFVRSSPGAGTTFTIYLPSLPMAFPEQARGNEPAGITHEGGAVLVMDDEEMVRDLAILTLGPLGYTIKTCDNGKEAIALYTSAKESGTPFSVVIMDLTIPGSMGGVETAKRILAFDPEATMVVSSGYSEDPVMTNYRDYGFCAAIEKPYQAEDIARVISSQSEKAGRTTA